MYTKWSKHTKVADTSIAQEYVYLPNGANIQTSGGGILQAWHKKMYTFDGIFNLYIPHYKILIEYVNQIDS